MKRLLLAAAAACMLPWALPCVAQKPAAEARMTPAQLDQAIYAFADRYAVNLAAAIDVIARDNPSAEQRRIAHLVKLGSVSSVYDIATESDPFRKLMDLLMTVTLQSYSWIDEDRAEREFGARGVTLMRTLRQLRVDVWKLAGQVLRPEQLQQLDALILDWRRQNADLQLLSYVRFDDISDEDNRDVLEEFKQATGWFGIGEATKAVDEARLLGERAFYQAKRMPYLVNWQMQAVLNETLAKPEIAQTLQAADSLIRTADRISAVAEKIPAQVAAEREAVVAVLEDRNGKVSALLGEMRKTTASADEVARNTLKVAEAGERLSLTMRDTVRTVDAMQVRGAASKPFDIEPYVRASVELNQAVAGINSALLRLESSSQKAGEALAAPIDRLFYYALALMAAFFLMLLAYRMLATRLPRRA